MQIIFPESLLPVQGNRAEYGIKLTPHASGIARPRTRPPELVLKDPIIPWEAVGVYPDQGLDQGFEVCQASAMAVLPLPLDGAKSEELPWERVGVYPDHGLDQGSDVCQASAMRDSARVVLNRVQYKTVQFERAALP